MPARIWKGATRPSHMKGAPITAEMARALEALKRSSMDRWRRGYADSPRGPFFALGTIDSLWKRGLVDFSPVIKRAYITGEGLKALDDWRDEQVEAA